MTLTALLLVVAAAVMHAAWNALAKRAGDTFGFLWLSLTFGALTLAPVAVVIAVTEGIPTSAWAYVASTCAVHAIYFYALGRAYADGDLSVVYPIARGTGVIGAAAAAWVFLGDAVSPLGGAGIAIVVVGIVLAGIARRESSAAERDAAHRRGVMWALVTGATISTYSVVDATGVHELHPVVYVDALGLGTAALLAPLAWRRRAAIATEWRRSRAAIAGAAWMTLVAYGLVLFAFRIAHTGYVVAARELSIALAAIAGAVWLHEGRVRLRLATALVILSGVACVVAARP